MISLHQVHHAYWIHTGLVPKDVKSAQGWERRVRQKVPHICLCASLPFLASLKMMSTRTTCILHLTYSWLLYHLTPNFF